jgi:hypothetical protein
MCDLLNTKIFWLRSVYLQASVLERDEWQRIFTAVGDEREWFAMYFYKKKKCSDGLHLKSRVWLCTLARAALAVGSVKTRRP